MPDDYSQEQNAIFDQYPNARPFADLIMGDSEEDVEELAREIDRRVRASAPAPVPSPAVPATQDTPAQPGLLDAMDRSTRGPGPPVIGGGAGYAQEAAVQDRVSQAVRKKSFSDFLTAKWEDGDDLAVS